MGTGIDLGCGLDPITPDCMKWDREQGDAQLVTGLLPESFDWVYSSHLLEHLPKPLEALLRWWALVRPGGTMVIIVPEESAYEQNVWPSTFNDEHCHGFSLFVSKSWCPAHLNLLEMVQLLPLVKLLRAEIIDERPPAAERRDWTLEGRIAHCEVVLQKQPQHYQIGSPLDQLSFCPTCHRSLVLVGHKGTILHCRCKGCGAPVTCDVGQHG